MHKLYKSIISKNNLDTIYHRVKRLGVDSSQKRHFTSKGKVFFNGLSGRILLRNILKDIKNNSSVFDMFETPVIDHAFFLLKTGKGPATPMHQDRPFWLTKENDPAKMLTLWFSCEKINETNGCLNVPVNSKNLEGVVLNYKKLKKAEGNFEYIIEDFNMQIKSVEMDAGDLLIFNSYEPHSSHKNSSNFPRLAFKIVIGENNNFIDKYKRIDVFNFLKYSIFYFPLRKLNFFK